MISAHSRGALPALLVFLLIAGCVNLGGVRDFSETSARTADYTRLVDVYVEHPGLQKRFAPELADILDPEQAKRETQRAGLLALHQAIEEYMLALANLSADEAVDYQTDFEALGKALGDAGVEDAQRQAVVTVGALVARAASDGYRRKKIREVIREANEPLQVTIQTLRDIVDQIAAEAQDLDTSVGRFYESRLREARERGNSGVETILSGWEYRERDEIEKIARAAVDYSGALEKISAAHEELFLHLDEINSDELQREMRFYAKEIRTAVKTLREL